MSGCDTQAHAIAAEWHAGVGSALLALATTGEIRRTDLLLELGECIRSTQSEMRTARSLGHMPHPYLRSELRELRWLSRYVRHQGDREPVPGWVRALAGMAPPAAVSGSGR